MRQVNASDGRSRTHTGAISGPISRTVSDRARRAVGAGSRWRSQRPSQAFRAGRGVQQCRQPRGGRSPDVLSAATTAARSDRRRGPCRAKTATGASPLTGWLSRRNRPARCTTRGTGCAGWRTAWMGATSRPIVTAESRFSVRTRGGCLLQFANAACCEHRQRTVEGTP